MITAFAHSSIRLSVTKLSTGISKSVDVQLTNDQIAMLADNAVGIQEYRAIAASVARRGYRALTGRSRANIEYIYSTLVAVLLEDGGARGVQQIEDYDFVMTATVEGASEAEDVSEVEIEAMMKSISSAAQVTVEEPAEPVSSPVPALAVIRMFPNESGRVEDAEKAYTAARVAAGVFDADDPYDDRVFANVPASIFLANPSLSVHEGTVLLRELELLMEPSFEEIEAEATKRRPSVQVGSQQESLELASRIADRASMRHQIQSDEKFHANA